MTSFFISPQDIGMPPKFLHWRDGQVPILQEAVEHDEGVLVQVVPTGGGKSVNYMASALLYGGRTIILTSTKGLQDQIEREFGDLVSVVKGKSAYKCRLTQGPVLYGPCHWGYQCRFKLLGCPYHDAIRKACVSTIVVTNYSFWMANAPDTLGSFDYMVGDEAHSIPDHLLDNRGVRLSRKECEKVAAWPQGGKDMAYYKVWASVMKQHLVRVLDKIKEGGDVDTPEAHEILALSRKVMKLDTVRGENWVVEHTGDHLSFDMVWTEPFMTEHDLIRGVPRVLLTSATINKKTMALLRLREYSYSEYPSTFPPSRCPIYFVPVVGVDHRITDAGFSAWLTAIDNVIRPRQHRKGLIHTVSYDRATRLCNTSTFRHHMMRHDKHTTRDIVDRFKRVSAPAILVSPSMTTGWDFPHEECRWSIIGKVPFPDGRSKVMEARTKLDPGYPSYVTMQAVVQACGRGMRSKDDYCETFILDSHWGWFLNKNKHLAPKWFLAALQEHRTLPLPLGA